MNTMETSRDGAPLVLILGLGETGAAAASWCARQGARLRVADTRAEPGGLAALREVDGPVLFAHADLSGYSVFEEAAWWGVVAAGRILGQAPPQT